MSNSTQIADNLIHIPVGIGNAYLVGDSDSFVLVDSGPQGNSATIISVVEEQFGPDASPECIVLTHGHFDHSGSADTLADHWDIDIFAHPLEHPYLDGRASYPPPDPTVGGFMAQAIRFVPIKQPNLSGRLQELDPDDEIPGMEGWDIIETPGHTPGHISFFRHEDRTLIAGDAFCTMNQDSMVDTLSRKQVVWRPPTYYTFDWEEAEISVRRLATLRPDVLAAGHGVPMSGPDATQQLRQLAKNFPIPEHGRYVDQPAQFNHNGVTFLPPPVPDPVKWTALAVLSSVAVAGAGWAVNRKRSRQQQDWPDINRAA
jgi:glyoxylase-like metal-dependent hydrolase (beta-lactamase superfamily II)